MAEIIFKVNRCISLGSVECEEDLKPIPGMRSINPPPSDGRCDCCKRDISELEPFGGPPGDPLSGALLVKRWRTVGPYNGEAVRALDEAERRSEDPLAWLTDKYGREKGKWLFYAASAWCQSCASWECRDCFILDEDEYHEKFRGRLPNSGTGHPV